MSLAAIPEADRPQVERILRARFGRLLDFATYTFPGYQRVPHLELVAEKLEAVERGEIKRLLIHMPPRHGKSELVSVRFPAWFLCRNPHKAVISVAHNDRLSANWGRRVRNIVDNQPLFPKVRLAGDSKAKDLWHTEQGGQYLAVGFNAASVGWGADLLLIDDPHGHAGELGSEIQKATVWDIWTTELRTRLEPNGAIVVVMHRWDEADFSGRLQESGEWEVIRLPAFAEEDDPLGRSPGEPLWEERYDRAALEELAHEMGERRWSAMGQQRPSPEEGEIFKSFGRYAPEQLTGLRAIRIAIDTALGGEDYTAWSSWGWDGSRVYLLEADQYRGETPEAGRRVQYFYNKTRQQYPNIPVEGLHRGRVNIDKAFAQRLREGVPTITEEGLGRMGMPVREVKLPIVGKEGTAPIARALSVEFDGGRALIPEWASWLEPWLEQHKGFPHAKHDDFVETTLLVLWDLFRAAPFVRPKPRPFWPKGV